MSLVGKYFSKDIEERIRLVIIFTLSCMAFFIAFRYGYSRKFLNISFILWIFVVYIKDLKYFFSQKIVIIISSFIIVHIISLLYTENIHEGYRYIEVMLVYIFAPIMLIVTLVKNKKDINFIIGGFIFGMFINEIISYLIYFDLFQTEYSKIHRYPVGFMNHIPYSVLVSFCAILILYQSRHIENKYLKVIYVVFFMTMTTNLVISAGRTGYVVYFVSLIVMLFSYYKFNWKNFLQVLLFPIIIFYIGYKLNEDVQKRVEASLVAVNKISDSGNYNTSFGQRLAFFPLSIDILNDNNPPFSYIFGIGAGDVKSELVESVKRTSLINVQHTNTHNSWLEALLHTGIIGLFLLLYLFYSIWKIEVKDKDIAFLKQLIVLVMGIGMLSHRCFNDTPTMYFFAVFVGIILASKKLELTSNNENNKGIA